MSRINHVSINARDLQESVDFYVELLGAEPIATPNFGFPVQWLALGDTQLHLFQKDVTPQSHHHLGITVGDAFDRKAFGNHLVELPGDLVQLYVRDPSGNLVEIDHVGAGRLAEDVRSQLMRLEDVNPQSDENLSARLFIGV